MGGTLLARRVDGNSTASNVATPPKQLQSSACVTLIISKAPHASRTGASGSSSCRRACCSLQVHARGQHIRGPPVNERIQLSGCVVKARASSSTGRARKAEMIERGRRGKNAAEAPSS